MSLTIGFTGYGKEYFRESLIEYINEELEKCNLTRYQNKHIKLPCELPSVSWSWRELNNLQFIAIQLSDNPTWRPQKNSSYEQKISQACYQKFYVENKSHLICCDKWGDNLFVPIKFPKDALLNCNHHLCNFGSSINLSEELKIMAYKLGFDLRKYNPAIDFDENDCLVFEKFAMFKLYSMTIASIKYNLILKFN